LLNQAKIIEQELRKMRIDQTNSSTNLYRWIIIIKKFVRIMWTEKVLL
jgi:hypothetical protein